MADRGVVAAGHPLTAQAGADILRAGGNAVDAALAALMMSLMTEPLLTGLGAGGYMLVAPPGGEPVLLDFMVASPSNGERAPLDAVVLDFGDAVQVFHIGAASCGVYGVPAGVAEASARFGSVPLPDLAAPAVAAARDGVVTNATQALLWELLGPIAFATPESRARYLLDGRRRARATWCAIPTSPTRSSGWRPRARARSTRATSGRPCRTGCSSAAGRSPAPTCTPTPRSRVSRSTSATTAARCSPTRRRAPAAC